RLRGFHSNRCTHLLAHLLRGEWPRLGRTLVDITARGASWLPRLRERAGFSTCLLPRLLRDRLYHHSIDWSGGREDWHRLNLAWLVVWRKYADNLLASAIWFCLVLFALGGRPRALQRQDDRQSHRASHYGPNLLGRCAICDHPVHNGRVGDWLPRHGDA